MAKEIPYFKFYIAEWSEGDITLESFELQGLFINICAYYWSKKCQVTLLNVKKKFSSKTSGVDDLITSKCIKVKGENISISFLNEQYASKEIQTVVNRNNGALGGRPPIKKTEYKPNGLIFENQNITNIEKSIEDIIDTKVSIVGLAKPTPTKLSSFDKGKMFVDRFNKIRGTKYKPIKKVCSALNSRLQNYTTTQIFTALKSAMKEDHHINTKFKYLTPEFILREDKLEAYFNAPEMTEESNFEPLMADN